MLLFHLAVLTHRTESKHIEIFLFLLYECYKNGKKLKKIGHNINCLSFLRKILEEILVK